ncbi:MAG: hypothetical protein ACYTGS_04075 [Planctomycetota bacterium]|jgi:hypothetical protein
MDRTLTLYIPGSTWKSLKLLASKRDKTVEELISAATGRFISRAMDDAYRAAMQAKQDEGYAGSFQDYLKEHPGCVMEHLR